MRRAHPSIFVLLFVFLVSAPPAPAAPSEVTGLTWCTGQATCLQWNAASGATSYNLYRGEGPACRASSTPRSTHAAAARTSRHPRGQRSLRNPTRDDVLVPRHRRGLLRRGQCGIGDDGARILNTSGTCAPSCRPAGAACLTNNDCCSANCNGMCQSSCCQLPATPADARAVLRGGVRRRCVRRPLLGACRLPRVGHGVRDADVRRGKLWSQLRSQGRAVPTQTPGDCQSRRCDGEGGYMNMPDNSDVPVDGAQCTSDVCTEGVPSNPPAPINTPCTQNGGTVCDGAGAAFSARRTPSARQRHGVPVARVQRRRLRLRLRASGDDLPRRRVRRARRLSPAAAGRRDVAGDGGSAIASTSISVTFRRQWIRDAHGTNGRRGVHGSVQASANYFVSCVAFSASQATMSAGTPSRRFSRRRVCSSTTVQDPRDNGRAKRRGPSAAVDVHPALGFDTTSPNFAAARS